MKTEKILLPETFSLDSETVCFKMSNTQLHGKSFLVVPEGWEALCLNDGQLGKILKRGKYKLASLKGKSHVFEVLFYPTLREFSFLWGTKDQMDFSDPLYSLPVKMGANGKLIFLIKNIRNVYLTSKQSENINALDIKAQVVASMVKFLQEQIAGYVKDKKLSFLEFEKNKDAIFKEIFPALAFFMQNEFGLKLSNFLVDGIIFDKNLFSQLEKAAKKEKEIELEEELEKQKKQTLQTNLMLEKQIQEIKQEQFEKQEEKLATYSQQEYDEDQMLLL